ALMLTGTAGSRFGHAVSTAGDVNSDGFSDVIIGAPVAGTASVHLGSGGGTIATPHIVITGPQAGSAFGFAVATAGDVNGSGFSDIIIGAPDFSNGEAGEGAAYAYHGSDSGLVATQAWVREGTRAGVRFGASVAGVGDVNGDGFFDAVVGSPNWDLTGPGRGAAFFFIGTSTGLINNVGSRINGTLNNQQFGYCVAEGGDINGDGYADFLVGGPFWSSGQAEEGITTVYTGRATGVGYIANGNWQPNLVGNRSGWSVAGGGDVDGDGFSDVVVGSPNANVDQGSFTILRGNWSNSVSRPTRLYRADLVSPLATNALDPADGLYFGIGHVARSHMQRKDGRLIWEVVHEGQPYSMNPVSNSITNSQGFTDLSAGWTDLGLNGTEIREQVYKEPFFRRYKWRVRVEWPIHRSMDGQRFSRWYYGYASAHGDIGVLPLELLEFTGETERSSNVLRWTTATETGTSHFVLERSIDNRNFISLGVVAAAGNSLASIEYRYEDNDPPQGLAYYRLRMQDLDGSFEHSPVIALQRGTTLNIHPNPVAELLTWDVQEDQVQRARILDALGRLIADVPATTGTIQGGPLVGLPYGYYTLVLLDGSGNVVARSRFLKV
ncbi:MAG: integrin alpha, partial [Flavobacteriales bacterium]